MGSTSSRKYFIDGYELIRYPVDQAERPGFRRGQLGAIHALAGHLAVRPEPAVVVMPTGAGKTGVLMLTPFVQRSKRALVVTPSRLVRGQIAENFAVLGILRRLGVVPSEMERPCVRELRKKMTDEADWKDLEDADVVVTTPFTIAPVLKGIAKPPEDFFDLLLIDEAHHLGAKVWRSVVDAFPRAQKALFTATPYRRDRREIRGVIAFNYTLSAARNDGVFGDIVFVPVKRSSSASSDELIATASAAALREDKRNGFDHRILVRADTIERGKGLLKLYKKVAKLRLELVYGALSNRKVSKVIEQLSDGTLDGIVCVNMLGEGFDCPNLKVAALHAPHRSLGVILQFIGRFARVGKGKLGPARFFAEPAEISGETRRLFSEDAVWQDLVQNLSEGRVEEERELREQLATFTVEPDTDPDFTDLSLYGIRPKFHAKVYPVDDVPVDLTKPLTLPPPFEVVHSQLNEEGTARVAIARERQKPGWASEPRLDRVEYELFIVYFDSASSLLFINATKRSDKLYRFIATSYQVSPRSMSLYKMNRVLNGLSDVRCYSVGMRTRIHTSRNESYRMLAGSRAEQAIRRTDGRLFHRGHVACTALDGGEVVTIGYSPSKVWSSAGGHIPDLLAWCKELAKKMVSDGPLTPVPGLDHISPGEPLKTLPTNVLAADWDYETWEEQMEFGITNVNGELVKKPLTELSLRVDRSRCTPKSLHIIAECEEDTWELAFTPHDRTLFSYASPPARPATVYAGDDELPLPDYLNEYPLHVYFADFSRLRGDEWFPCKEPADHFDRSGIRPIQWDKAGVDIQREFWKSGSRPIGAKLSIHEYLEKVLNEPKHAVVFYDHRSGEVADFLAVSDTTSGVVIRLFHCKGSGGPTPGDRIGDIYEVCGQVIKSFHLLYDDKELLKHVRRREEGGSKFVRGDVATFERLLKEGRIRGLSHEFVVVQPGISIKKLSAEGAEVLSAASEHVHQLGAMELAIWGSD